MTLAGEQVLVTGASGFIGSRLAEVLFTEHRAKVRCLIRKPMHAARIARYPMELVSGDLTNAQSLARALNGVTRVFHLAFDFSDPQSNVTALHNLALASKAVGVRQLMHTSTISVFEPLPSGDVNETSPKQDSGDLYGDAKRAVEREALRLVQEGCPIAIVQPTIVYGPYSAGWTDTPVQQLLSGTVLLPDDGKGICNCVYVDDVVQGMILAAQEPKAVGNTFLLSGPDYPTWAEFYAAYAQTVGAAPPRFMSKAEMLNLSRGTLSNARLTVGDPKRIFRIKAMRNLGMFVKDKLGDSMKQILKDTYSIYRKVAPRPVYLPDTIRIELLAATSKISIEKARRVLGYAPKFDFRAGMEATRAYIEWAYRLADTARARS